VSIVTRIEGFEDVYKLAGNIKVVDVEWQFIAS
jgi:hypothetical protein